MSLRPETVGPQERSGDVVGEVSEPERAARRCSSRPLNLPCLSSREFGPGCGVEATVDFAGEVALEAASDFAEGASFGGASFEVGTCSWVHAHARNDGHVQGPVEASVTAVVDAVPDGVARGRGDRAGAGEAGERGLGSDASQVGPRGQRDRGGDWVDAGLIEQFSRGALADEFSDALGDLLEFLVERGDALGESVGFASGGGGGEVFVSGSPRGDRGDLCGGEGGDARRCRGLRRATSR